jgi:pimeloyl-ACP methyl ester carboxylesterase
MENSTLGSHVQSNSTDTYTHQTAPTQYIDAAGITFAYRRFGKKQGIPLVFNVHFLGTIDHWDPLVTDSIAKDREVILFDNAGVGRTTGEVPSSIYEMAKYAEAFVDALGLKQIDLLGFSMGGVIAQQFTLDRPELVRKLILVGTGPRGGESMQGPTPEGKEIFTAKYEKPEEVWLKVFFGPSETSQAAGRRFLERFKLRKEDRDLEVSAAVGPAQRAALSSYSVITDDRYSDLAKIKQPTLIVNGNHDVIIYTINSYIMQQRLPDATLVLFPDSAHGSLYQYPEQFTNYVNQFLNK